MCSPLAREIVNADRAIRGSKRIEKSKTLNMVMSDENSLAAVLPQGPRVSFLFFSEGSCRTVDGVRSAICLSSEGTSPDRSR